MTARLAFLAFLLLLSSVGAIACEIDCIPHVVHCHKVLIQTDEASPQFSQAAVAVEFSASLTPIEIPGLAVSAVTAIVVFTPIVCSPLLRSTVFRI